MDGRRYTTYERNLEKEIATLRAALEQAIVAERERCAAVSEMWGATHDAGETVNARNASSKIARGIRRHTGER